MVGTRPGALKHLRVWHHIACTRPGLHAACVMAYSRLRYPDIALMTPATRQDSGHCNRRRAVAVGVRGDMAIGSHRWALASDQQRYRCTVLLSLTAADSNKWRKPRADSYQKYGPLDLLGAAAASGVRRFSFGVARPSHASSLRSELQLPQGSRRLPALPPEVWQVIARATLAACNNSLSAWLQLSMVSRDWRQALKGAWYPCLVAVPVRTPVNSERAAGSILHACCIE